MTDAPTQVEIEAVAEPTKYDMSIHSNPDAAAWAAFFKATFPDSDEGLMIGWFANAMMAMHDHMQDERDAANARADAAGSALERDRSFVADTVNAVHSEISGREWMLTGRGPYEWDDDRYRDEFGSALSAIRAPIEKLRAIARDWSNCPTDPVEIQKSRTDWKARAEQARDAALVEAAAWHVRQAEAAMGALHCGSENSEIRVAGRANDMHREAATAILALRDKPAPAVTVERVQHIKRGTTYQIVARGKLQTDTPLNDYAELVAYRCEASGDVWFRPQSEFTPDRFRAIAGGGDE